MGEKDIHFAMAPGYFGDRLDNDAKWLEATVRKLPNVLEINQGVFYDDQPGRVNGELVGGHEVILSDMPADVEALLGLGDLIGACTFPVAVTINGQQYLSSVTLGWKE